MDTEIHPITPAVQQQSAIQCNQGERLKRLRAALQVEWKVFAQRMDLSVSMCMQVVKGTKNLSDLALFRLEEVERSAGLYQPPPIVRETPPPYSAASKKDSISVKREDIREIAAALRSLSARVDQLEKRLNNEG
jgi:transcriptional regulator with XRE-family HTH domain